VATVSQTDPPTALITRLIEEQPAASGERARKIAYALAVFNVDYEKNREFLLRTFNNCLLQTKDWSDEDDGCNDGMLLDYLTNLYWRGDGVLLRPLLELANSHAYALRGVDDFYADLLERRTPDAVRELEMLSTEKQSLICKMAGESGLVVGSLKFDRVVKRLHSAGVPAAERCEQAVAQSAARVPRRAAN